MASEDYTRDSARTYGRTWPRTVAEPSLFLNFTSATALDPRITFSRGSQATLFDSTGTLVYAKHNLVLQSQDFATTWGVLRASISTGATTAPNGTVTADKLVEDTTASNTHIVRQIGLTITNATPYLFSVYLKAGERTKAILQTTNTGFSNNAYVIFDLIAGTVVANVSATSAAIVDVGNGWYRCSMGNTSTGTAGNLTIGLVDAANNPSYTGDGTSGVYIWGAQLNLANMEGGVTSSLTTYYPTTTAAYYAPRFDYNPSTLQPRGLLIEEQRTNSIRNNTMQGAVAGTPGTLPTNWQTLGAGIGTLTQTVVGTGTSAGIAYIDIRLNGTTSTTSYGFGFDVFTQIAALVGQTWTSTFYVARVGGSTTNLLNIYNRIVDRDSGGANLGSSIIDFLPTISTTLTRIPITRTLAVAGTAAVSNDVLFVFAPGVAIDITLRIGLPQLEQGAFATSVIPTTTTALTRSADFASMTGTNFSSWYNASEGTMFVAYQKNAGATGRLAVFEQSNTLTTNGINIDLTGATTARTEGFAGGSLQWALTRTVAQGAPQKLCLGYKVDDIAFVANGGAVATDTSAVIAATGITGLGIGTRLTGGDYLNGYIQRLAYYPTRLPNATLVALTA